MSRSRAYEKDLTGVRELAVATVRAHLGKLAVEGAIRRDGERAGSVCDEERWPTQSRHFLPVDIYG